MGPKRPEDLNPMFAHAANAGDLPALLVLYDPGAKLVSRTGEVAEGHVAIESSLRRLIAMGGKVSSTTAFCLVQGELALVQADWAIADGRTETGSPVNLAARSSEFLRRQLDGTWKVLLDHPFAHVLSK